MRPFCLRKQSSNSLSLTRLLLLVTALFAVHLSSGALLAQTFDTIPALSFTKPYAGADPVAQVLTVASTGANFGFNATVTTSGGGNWLSISGLGCGGGCGTTPAIVQVVVTTSAAMAAGTYTGQVVFSAPGKALTVPVTLIIEAPGTAFLDSLAGALNYSLPTHGASPPAQILEIRRSGGGALNWTLGASTADGGNWLQVSASSGATPSIVTVSVNASALPNGALVAGTFVGQVVVQAPSGNVTVPVSVTVNDAALQQINVLEFSKIYAGQDPLPQTITVATANNSSVGFTATTDTANGGNWLSISGLGCGGSCGSAPEVVTVIVSPSVTLAAGTYTGEVVITTTTQAVTVPVTLTIAPAGSGFLTNEPGQLGFTMKTQGAAPPPQTFSILNGSSTAILNWTAKAVTADSGNWLTLSTTAGNTPGLLTLTVVPANLPNGGLVAGTFTGQVLIREAGSAVTVPVSVTVGDNVLNQIQGISFNKPQAGRDPLPQTLTIATPGAAVGFNASVSTASGGQWLSIEGLGCGGVCGSTPEVIRVIVTADVTLPAGVYSGQVIISSGKEAISVPVNLTVGSPSTAFFDNVPGQMSFSLQPGGASPTAQTVQIRNGGAGTLAWTVTAATSDSGNWLTVTPTSGVAPSTVTVSINPSALPNGGLVAGTFTGNLTFFGGGTSVTIPISVIVGASVFKQVAPLVFTKAFGAGNPLSQAFTVASTGTAIGFNGYAYSATGGNWLTITGLGCGGSCGSTSAVITAQINSPATQPAGIYTGEIIVTSGAMAMTVPVTLNVGQVVVNPPSAPVLTSPANGATGVSVNPTLTWTAASGATSYDVYFGTSSTPPLVTNTTGTSYSPTGLAANTTYYWQVIAKNSGGSTSSASTYSFTTTGPTTTLTTSAAIALYNTYSLFTVFANAPSSQSRTITLSSSPSATAYNSSVSGSPTFVTVSPSSGTTPATITLTANPTGLNPGTYTNTITFSGGGGIAVYTVVLTVLPATSTGPSSTKVGIYRAATGLFLIDSNGDGSCCGGDVVGVIGQTGDLPLSGDWSGNGIKKFGLYRPSSGLFLLDVNNSGSFDSGDKALFFSAVAGDIPVVGDWTGTGVDRAGIFRGSNGTWYLDLNGDGSFTGRAFLGQNGDIPLVGNWNGVGKVSKVGIYRPTSVNGQPGNFFLVDTNGDGQYTGADQPLFFLGQPGDIPIVGDWSGDGKSKVGVFRPAGSANGAGLIILDQNGSFSFDGPGTDRILYFAAYLNGLSNITTIQPGDMPVVGNWLPSYGASNTANIQGRSRVGVYRPGSGTYFLDVSADGTFQAQAFFGQSGDLPLGVPIISNGTVIGAY